MKVKFKRNIFSNLIKASVRNRISHNAILEISRLFNNSFLLLSVTALSFYNELVQEISNDENYTVNLPIRSSIASETLIYSQTERMNAILEKAFEQQCREICIYGVTEDVGLQMLSHNLNKNILAFFDDRIVAFKIYVDFNEPYTELSFSKFLDNKDLRKKICECFFETQQFKN